jgi:hypothetical protein
MKTGGQKISVTLALGLVWGWAAVRSVDAQEAAGGAAVESVARATRLNNCVTELLTLSPLPARANTQWPFTNPRDGWVFVRSTANLTSRGRLSVLIEPPLPGQSSPASQPNRSNDRNKLLLVHAKTGVDTQEGMRFLPAGEYHVRFQSEGAASVQRLVVHAVPELIFCKFQYDPFISPHGPYDWTFLQQHIAASANCIVGSGAEPHREFVKSWKQQGKRWIVECGVPALDGKQPLTADEAYAYWTQNVGLTDPLLDGVVADEFLGNRPGMKYPEWTEAVRRIHAANAFRGKFFYPYCTAIFRDPVSAEFLRTVMRSGYPFAWEVYLQEQPDEAAARKHLEAKLAAEMWRWRAALPHCEQHMILCFGYMSLPTTETLNMDPQVDFKVWMDMQFQHVATDPAFDGLYGLMEYTCGYADEETVRWAARLYRHYGIEGHTALLSRSLGFKYRLDHLENPDFADGTKAWTVEPAEPGSAEASAMQGYGWLQGRYPRTSRGDTFLWAKRGAQKPNLVSQELKNLQPGTLYSLKTVTADYQELQRGKSVRQTHAVSLAVEGVTVLPGKSFQHVMANNYAHPLGAFNEQNQAWMNYHFRVFRATGPTAKLVLSDWASPGAPGGPAGQELMFNFIEVQPYLEE